MMDMNYQAENRPHFSGVVTKEAGDPVHPVRGIEFKEFVGTVIDYWRLISLIILLMLSAGVFYIIIAQPVYRADVLLQVENKPKGITALADLSELLQEEPSITAEFEIIKSRMVLDTVVDNLKLDIIAKPLHYPLANLFINPENNRIKVENFDVPKSYYDKEFRLVKVEENGYLLFDPDDNLLLQGEVGKPYKITLDDEKNIRLFVSELGSKPGDQFEVVKKSRLSSINQLKQKLVIAEQGKQSGILLMTLEGANPGKITDILNEIANIYLRQSVERKSAEAEKTLKFLEKQLPLLREKMEDAEAALNNYRLQKGSIDLSMETQATLDKMVSIDAQLTQLRSDREELIRQFTEAHPRIASIDAQIVNLNNELKEVESKVQVLPGTQQEILRLTRDMEVSSSLYTSLMNSAQELKVVKAGAVGNVRIVDYAVAPDQPIRPKKGLVIALMLMLGGLLGVGMALISKTLRGAIEDPDIVEKKLGLPVYATIPYSRKQRDLSLSRRYSRRNQSRSVNQRILAAADPDDLAVESLRSLRTSLYFAKLTAKNNILLVTSPGPGAGKSFLCLNLATVLSDTDRKVLVIDADMRKGRVHQLLDMHRKPGLSDLLAGDNGFNDVIYKTEIDNLFVLTAGTMIPKPSEILMQERFERVLEKISSSFDHVIIDSPPVLAVTDAAIIGRHTGSTLLVIRDGQSTVREIEQSMKRLKQADVNLRGAVFNGMKLAAGRYGYSTYYGYAYKK